jgi:hypothetical protein
MGVLKLWGWDVPGLAERCQPGIPPAQFHHHHGQALPEITGIAVGRHIHQGTLDNESNQAATVGRAEQPHVPHLADQVFGSYKAVAMAHDQGGSPEQQETHHGGAKSEGDQEGLEQERRRV